MVFTQPELEKWPETDHETPNGCKEVMCIRKHLYSLITCSELDFFVAFFSQHQVGFAT